MSVEKFWSELEGVQSAMLSIGDARHVPMSPYARQTDGAIWFITAQGTDLVQAAESGDPAASLIVSGQNNMHARIEGEAAVVQDRAKLEELWNPIAETWFDGIDDPDVRLLRVIPATAEVWLTPGAIGFAVEMVKAKVSGKEPDMGDHFTVTF